MGNNMSTSITVRRFLDTQDVPYSVTRISRGENGKLFSEGKEIPSASIAKAVILKDIRGMLMAVFPITHRLSMNTLNHQLHRRLEPADTADYHSVFADCTPGLLPALGEAYGFETIIDDSLLDQNHVYLASGNAGELIRLSGADFQLLHSNAWYGNTFSSISEGPMQKKSPGGTPPAPTAGPNDSGIIPIADMRRRIERINELPAMPSLAQRIIQLNANPYAHAEDLAKLVERDPSLSAQIVRYAQSPFYGYPGKIASVRQAISRVLGYDMVMNMALGIAAARPFKLPVDGPLGLGEFWRHATYSATLMQSLCKIIPREKRPRPGTAYLTGLLHNFGFLLLGHLFPKEFNVLSKAIRKEPEIPVVEQEQRLLGISHMEMGGWLMEAWNMPEEILVTQREHHNTAYDGPHANYVHLLLISGALLKSHEIGEASSSELPERSLLALGLSEEDAIGVLENTIENRESLDTMARQLVA